MTAKSNVLRSIALTAIPVSVVAWLGTLPSPWASWMPATCMPDHCFCEALRPALVRQPTNTMTSFVFMTVAFVVFGLPGVTERPSRKNLLSTTPVHSSLFASALALIGLGSAFYHASLSFVGQTGDVLGMYLLGTFILLYNFARWRPLSPTRAGAAYVVGNLVLLGLLIGIPELRRYAFAAIIVGALSLEWRIRRERGVSADARLLLAAVGTFAVGFAFWILDLTGAVCAPESLLQGHGLWHLTGAASAALVYAYYRSESYAEE
ncbi:MAG TPA: ceramidase domain-containing protein [Longimicrobiales bacterium]|nr:ceramidase domain-containing protein [Longimicrobiales bacterium]